MQRVILVLIILLALLALLLGVYFLMSGLNKKTDSTVQDNSQNQNTQNPNNFEIQGMKVQVLVQGSGEAVKINDNVTVHYTGWLADGVKFDSSVDRNAPFTFLLGNERVIKGWDLGVMGMKVGEKRKLTIPPDLAYGTAGFLTIPPNASLIFEIELLKIN